MMIGLHSVIIRAVVTTTTTTTMMGQQVGLPDSSKKKGRVVKRRFGWARMGAHLREDDCPGFVVSVAAGEGGDGGVAGIAVVALGGGNPKSWRRRGR